VEDELDFEPESQEQMEANAAWDEMAATALSKHCQLLMEHFDSVQIVVTKDERSQTRLAAFGAGNMFARMGSVRDWLDGSS
jgi:hypothetical protein